VKFLKRRKSKIQLKSIQNFLDIQLIDAVKKQRKNKLTMKKKKQQRSKMRTRKRTKKRTRTRKKKVTTTEHQ
jgi:hypothetical protein